MPRTGFAALRSCAIIIVLNVTEASSFSIESHRLKSLDFWREDRAFLLQVTFPSFSQLASTFFWEIWHDNDINVLHKSSHLFESTGQGSAEFMRLIKLLSSCAALIKKRHDYVLQSPDMCCPCELFARLVPLINCNNDKWMLNLHWFKQNQWRANCTFYHVESYWDLKAPSSFL